MKIHFALALLSLSVSALAQSPAPAPAATPAAATGAPPARGGGQQRDPRMDSYYKLGPDSLKQEGVPEGKWSGPHYLPSQVFPDVKHTYNVYIPAQYDPKVPTALMVFNDGQAMMAEPGPIQAHRVLDNLIYRREIPVMIAVFINPGRKPGQPEPTPKDWGDRTTIRKDEYDVPTDLYARVIVDELMPALKKEYNISPDPNLHGIMGSSSGGIAAFTTAFFRPNDFRKVISTVGSFTNLRGGHVVPDLVLQAEKKPIRVFLQDGRNDNRRPDALDRDWFSQNVKLKDALEKKGYEVNYVWGIGNHGEKQAGAILPEMMRWTWRDHPVSTDPNDKVERSFREAVQSN